MIYIYMIYIYDIYIYFYETMMFDLTIVGRYFPYYGSRIPIDDPFEAAETCTVHAECQTWSAQRGGLLVTGDGFPSSPQEK